MMSLYYIDQYAVITRSSLNIPSVSLTAFNITSADTSDACLIMSTLLARTRIFSAMSMDLLSRAGSECSFAVIFATFVMQDCRATQTSICQHG